MAYPCKSSPAKQHKFGAIRFVSPDRLEFIRACRYCPAVQAGKVVREKGLFTTRWEIQVEGPGQDMGTSEGAN